VSQLDSGGQSLNGRTKYEIHRRTETGWELRGWRNEMDAAIREAKCMFDLPGTEAVRVVRDHYDPILNAIRPNTVFRAAAPAAAAPSVSFWSRLRARRAPPPAEKAAPGNGLAVRLAVSLVVVSLGTAITLLRS